MVTDPGVLSPEKFISDVMTVRLPNPFMSDTPERIATDTSQKLAIRFGETIKAYRDSDTLDVADLKLIPLVFAGWLRYLMGMDDQGNEMQCSPDPVLALVGKGKGGLAFGKTENVESLFHSILEDGSVFGLNLYEVGMADKVCQYFAEMMAGPGAVRATLEKYVGK